ncbi:hypothetical protein DFH27DRAFT_579254 [Peziza echinospora]|nr:hypothetical protein DFH27DRAFT_579254 [Peziza echinospora]
MVRRRATAWVHRDSIDLDIRPTEDELNTLRASMSQVNATGGEELLPMVKFPDIRSTSTQAKTGAGLSPLENLLITVPHASDIILENLCLINYTFLAATSRSLWYFIHTHSHFRKIFNLRPYTASSVFALKTKRPQYVYPDDEEIRTFVSGEYMNILSRHAIKFILGNSLNDVQLVGQVAWRLLKRFIDVGNYPRHIIVENEWLGEIELQRILAKCIARECGLEVLEVNAFPHVDDREKWGKIYFQRPNPKVPKVVRHFVVLSEFMNGIVMNLPSRGPGLKKLILNFNLESLLPSLRCRRAMPVFRDLMEIMMNCKILKIDLNIGLCNSCSSDFTVEEIIAMIDAAPPRHTRKQNPFLLWQEENRNSVHIGEVPDIGRYCDDCGITDSEPICTVCLSNQKCERCRIYQCSKCRDIELSQLQTGFDPIIPSNPAQYNTFNCTSCTRTFDTSNIPSCAICGDPWETLTYCFLCQQGVCGVCEKQEQRTTAQNCNLCNEMLDDDEHVYINYMLGLPDGCGKHEYLSCENCLNTVCIACRSFSPLIEKTNELPHEPSFGDRREARASMRKGSMMPKECGTCEQWFCGECLPQCTCASKDSENNFSSNTSDNETDMESGRDICAVHSDKAHYCKECGYNLVDYCPQHTYEGSQAFFVGPHEEEVYSDGGSSEEEDWEGSSSGEPAPKLGLGKGFMISELLGYSDSD